MVGPFPTPGVAFITRAYRADAGIVISASHNPYYDNGIKFFSSEGFKLPDSWEEEMEELDRRNDFQDACRQTMILERIRKSMMPTDVISNLSKRLFHGVNVQKFEHCPGLRQWGRL